MRVLVQYIDGNFGFVDSGRLDELIILRRISGFRSSTGWVTIPSWRHDKGKSEWLTRGGKVT